VTDEDGAPIGFEQARDELEQVVRALEDGGTTLEQALALWERGEQLYRICRERLDAAEVRIRSLDEALAQRPDEPRGEDVPF
jgi:exodeoxyribonuclease VII small subunit